MHRVFRWMFANASLHHVQVPKFRLLTIPTLSVPPVLIRWTWCQSTSGVRTSWCAASTWRTSRRRRPEPWRSSTCWAGRLPASPPPPDRCSTSAGKGTTQLLKHAHTDVFSSSTGVIGFSYFRWQTGGQDAAGVMLRWLSGFDSTRSPSSHPSFFFMFPTGPPSFCMLWNQTTSLCCTFHTLSITSALCLSLPVSQCAGWQVCILTSPSVIFVVCS